MSVSKGNYHFGLGEVEVAGHLPHPFQRAEQHMFGRLEVVEEMSHQIDHHLNVVYELDSFNQFLLTSSVFVSFMIGWLHSASKFTKYATFCMLKIT